VARKLKFWSKSWNAHLVMDSSTVHHDFNDGAVAVLELVPDDELLTAVLR
jgi:hypothetical protein